VKLLHCHEYSGNTTNQSFNVTVKPLKDKYRVTTNATVGNPIRIANIRDNATISQADQQKIIDRLLQVIGLIFQHYQLQLYF
jgi:hypothetical protein